MIGIHELFKIIKVTGHSYYSDTIFVFQKFLVEKKCLFKKSPTRLDCRYANWCVSEIISSIKLTYERLYRSVSPRFHQGSCAYFYFNTRWKISQWFIKRVVIN